MTFVLITMNRNNLNYYREHSGIWLQVKKYYRKVRNLFSAFEFLFIGKAWVFPYFLYRMQFVQEQQKDRFFFDNTLN